MSARRLLLGAALLLPACFPPMPHDCVTRGGLFVQGSDRCEEIGAAQERVEMEALAMGRAPFLRGRWLYVRTTELDDNGGFSYRGWRVAGLAHCDLGRMTIAWGTKVERIEQTAFAHEAFHLMEGCPTRWETYDACKASGREEFACQYEATHDGWSAAIEPAIGRVNTLRAGTTTDAAP